MLPELPKNKRYFKIGEVADLFQVKASTLRHWEEQFPQLKPAKNPKGDRRYTPKDIEQVAEVHQLLKVKGLTIQGAKEALSPEARQKNKARLEKLKLLRKRLLHIQEVLDGKLGQGGADLD